MFIKVLRSKIHRARITDASVDYVGSITIDADLIDAAGLVHGECVLVANLTNGARFETYVIEGRRGGGTVCINGAAARLVRVDDLVIIMAFAYADIEQARNIRPAIVLVDRNNKAVRES